MLTPISNDCTTITACRTTVMSTFLLRTTNGAVDKLYTSENTFERQRQKLPPTKKITFHPRDLAKKKLSIREIEKQECNIRYGDS